MWKEWIKNSRSKAKVVFGAMRPAAVLVARPLRSNVFYCAAIKNIFCVLLLWYCLPVGLIACLVRAELSKQNRQKAAAAHSACADGQKRLHMAA